MRNHKLISLEIEVEKLRRQVNELEAVGDLQIAQRILSRDTLQRQPASITALAAQTFLPPQPEMRWSNPMPPSRALIAAALLRADFAVILLACLEHGVAEVREVLQALEAQEVIAVQVAAYVSRSLDNISIAFKRGGEQADGAS
jgi:hypothetical protein